MIFLTMNMFKKGHKYIKGKTKRDHEKEKENTIKQNKSKLMIK
jgi:hypothetical protein